MKYLILSLLFVGAGVFSKEFIPDNAAKYKRDLMRHSQYHFGLNAPTAVFAAQIHKESTWNPNAKSPYADGLTQFTPETAEWVSGKFPALVANEPLNPIWAIQALLIYDKYLLDRITYWGGEGTLKVCDDWSFALSAYNGGYGWVIRDRKLTRADGKDQNVWINNVELYTDRSDAARKENRGYPDKILHKLANLYRQNGWGPIIVCDPITYNLQHKCIMK
jgi:soluble lytic murein transglycosylase-like protein|tara:strand:- start:1961 stop:2620 length:660 start_codon:yes stop_codon:yes gene_type:complete